MLIDMHITNNDIQQEDLSKKVKQLEFDLEIKEKLYTQLQKRIQDQHSYFEKQLEQERIQHNQDLESLRLLLPSTLSKDIKQDSTTSLIPPISSSPSSNSNTSNVVNTSTFSRARASSLSIMRNLEEENARLRIQIDSIMKDNQHLMQQQQLNFDRSRNFTFHPMTQSSLSSPTSSPTSSSASSFDFHQDHLWKMEPRYATPMIDPIVVSTPISDEVNGLLARLELEVSYRTCIKHLICNIMLDSREDRSGAEYSEVGREIGGVIDTN